MNYFAECLKDQNLLEIELKKRAEFFDEPTHTEGYQLGVWVQILGKFKNVKTLQRPKPLKSQLKAIID